LAWSSERLAAQGLSALPLIWNNASWHTSQHVCTRVRQHNQIVKRIGQGVRINVLTSVKVKHKRLVPPVQIQYLVAVVKSKFTANVKHRYCITHSLMIRLDDRGLCWTKSRRQASEA
jgi:hypothetical protein